MKAEVVLINWSLETGKIWLCRWMGSLKLSVLNVTSWPLLQATAEALTVTDRLRMVLIIKAIWTCEIMTRIRDVSPKRVIRYSRFSWSRHSFMLKCSLSSLWTCVHAMRPVKTIPTAFQHDVPAHSWENPLNIHSMQKHCVCHKRKTNDFKLQYNLI